jgi:hypothetical protein
MHDTFAGVMEELAGKGVGLRALNGPELDITSAQGKLMLNVLSAISEFERDLLGERIKSGVAHARCKGTKSGKAIGRQVLCSTRLFSGARTVERKKSGYTLRTLSLNYRFELPLHSCPQRFSNLPISFSTLEISESK